jgi:two-component system cell cycle response regulator DivK
MPASSTKQKILLVDDDPQILELFSALLQEAGFEVDQADNALAAMAAVVRAAPDLIIADIQMPIVSGKGLVRELKTHSDSRHIPVVALTGFDRPGSREAALAAGYDDYLTKPIDARTFPEEIAKLLRQHQRA